MKRRTFIGIAAIGTLGLATSGGILLSDFDRLVAKILKEDTASLKIDPKQIDMFMHDANKARLWDMFSFSKKELIKWSFYLENPFLKLPYSVKYKIYRSQIVGMFLLSTDYFSNKMNDNMPVQYKGIYNPYFTPCSNPFSNLYYA